MAAETKKRRRLKAKEDLKVEGAEWEPLLRLARVYVDEFMWMCEVVLEDGARLQAYKNWWTRRYIHLDDRGRAFFFRGGNEYEEIPDEDLREFFDRVIWRCDPLWVRPLGDAVDDRSLTTAHPLFAPTRDT
jgi:hypothetical protein